MRGINIYSILIVHTYATPTVNFLGFFGGTGVWSEGFSLASYWSTYSEFYGVLFFFFSTGVWTQGLHLKPPHQPFLCCFFFEIGSHQTICLGWLWTMIPLISTSWVTRITGVRHWFWLWCLVFVGFFFFFFGTGFWAQGFELAKQALYQLSHVSSPSFFL
jgi:hypothetical protein